MIRHVGAFGFIEADQIKQRRKFAHWIEAFALNGPRHRAKAQGFDFGAVFTHACRDDNLKAGVTRGLGGGDAVRTERPVLGHGE